MQTQFQHVGSNSLTRDRTQASCTGSMESQLLEDQGRPFHATLTLHLPFLLTHNVLAILDYTIKIHSSSGPFSSPSPGSSSPQTFTQLASIKYPFQSHLLNDFFPNPPGQSSHFLPLVHFLLSLLYFYLSVHMC